MAARARHAALGVVGLGTNKRRCTSGRFLSFGARPWRAVPTVASNTKPSDGTRVRFEAGALEFTANE